MTAEHARAVSSSGMCEKTTLGQRLRMLPNTKKRARAMISSAKWPRGTPEQRFRAASGCGARPSSDFERKARPVRCFRMLPAWLGAFRLPIRAEDSIYEEHSEWFSGPTLVPNQFMRTKSDRRGHGVNLVKTVPCSRFTRPTQPLRKNERETNHICFWGSM